MLRVLLPGFLCVAAFLSSMSRAADTTEFPRTISVTGESAIYITPDEVIVRLGVETTDPTLDKARAENDAKAKALLNAIKAIGVEEKYIQTDNLNFDIRYDSHENSLKILGYVCRGEYTISLKDPTKTEPVVNAALGNGANLLLGVEYRAKELRKHRDEARKMAARAAREKADLLAVELSEAVGRPRTINEQPVGYYGWAGRMNRGSANMAQNSFQVTNEGAGIEGETIPIGQIAVSATVSVVFDLKEKS